MYLPNGSSLCVPWLVYRKFIHGVNRHSPVQLYSVSATFEFLFLGRLTNADIRRVARVIDRGLGDPLDPFLDGIRDVRDDLDSYIPMLGFFPYAAESHHVGTYSFQGSRRDAPSPALCVSNLVSSARPPVSLTITCL